MKALVLALAALLAVGCGGGLKSHARAASVAAVVIDSAGAAIEDVARSDYDRVKDAHLPDDQFVTAVQDLDAKYRPVESAYDALRETNKAYVDAIMKAVGEGKATLEGERASLVVQAWRALMGVAKDIDLTIPGIPQVVLDMIGAGR